MSDETTRPGAPDSHTVWGGQACSPQADQPRMTEYEFRLLRDYIHDYCGIFFDDQKAFTLARRVAFRLKLLDISSYAEYYNFLKFNPRASEEMDDLVPHLTNNETYFFREMPQLGVLTGDVLERVKGCRSKRGERKISILSCGCSSGEEAYTVAMLLDEEAARFAGWDVKITGVDIDRKVLEKAVAGTYTSYSLRATDKARMERFFTRSGEQYRVIDRIKSKVGFRRGNIKDRSVLAALSGADIILCRNVLIYFSEEAIKGIAENFYDLLSPDGFLFLGHSESLARITDIYHTKRYPNAIVYTKKGI